MTAFTPLKTHGGKHYLAKRIVALFPPRHPAPGGYIHFVEPYFGGGSVLLASDPEGISEVANDLHGELINFWITLREKSCYERFMRAIEAAPFSEGLFEASCQKQVEQGHIFSTDGSRADAAYWFFIRCRQSLAGRMKGFTGITKTRTRRGMNNEVSAWLSAVEGLPAVHERLKRVLITNRPAIEIIEGHDSPLTLFYLDPPYLHTTRATTSDYLHEMSLEQHRELLEVLSLVKGKFLLSGYHSPLYDEFAHRYGWRCVEFKVPNAASGAKEKREMTEVVWLNY